MQKLACILAIAVCFPANPTQADGLIHKLPADGSWARYDLQWHGPAPTGGLAVLRTGTPQRKKEPPASVQTRIEYATR